MYMWLVLEKKQIQKVLLKTPKEVVRRYEAWKRIVEISGVDGLKMIKGFHDEALKGNWKGYRSSRLGIQWRVIYKVEKDVFKIFVFEINPHKY
jgi:addiction module RelE/StbE family toxin